MSWTVNGYTWDLRYQATGLRALQMTMGGLDALARQLMHQGLGAQLSADAQALLVWAGQIATDRKLTLKKVKRILAELGDQGRGLVVSWASAEFCRTVLELASAQIDQAHPEIIAEGDGEAE